MKTLLVGLLFMSSLSSYGKTSYCGALTSLTLVTDSYAVVRMGLKNDDSDPSYLTIKDEQAVVQAIRLVSEDPDYTHTSDIDDYDWDRRNDENHYWLCVEGVNIREYREKFYLDRVNFMRVWKNGTQIF